MSSIKTAYLFMIFLAGTFALGVFMNRYDNLYAIFSQMNHSDITTWYRHLLEHPGFSVWFVLLVVSAVSIFLSTLDCTVLKRKNAVNNISVGGHLKTRYGIFTIHLVTLLVFACHAGDLFLVNRHAPVKMLPSDLLENEACSLRLVSVRYGSNPEWIKGLSSRKFMRLTPEQFDPRANWALVEIKGRDGKAEQHRIRFMSPASYKGNYFLVESFYYDETAEAVGIRLLRVHNPMVIFFFCVYLLFWVSMAVRWAKTRSSLNFLSRQS